MSSAGNLDIPTKMFETIQVNVKKKVGMHLWRVSPQLLYEAVFDELTELAVFVFQKGEYTEDDLIDFIKNRERAVVGLCLELLDDEPQHLTLWR